MRASGDWGLRSATPPVGRDDGGVAWRAGEDARNVVEQGSYISYLYIYMYYGTMVRAGILYSGVG